MPSPSILIRKYQPDDKPALLELLALNTPHYFAPEERADFDHYLGHETELYYVLLYEGLIVGCGGVNFADDRTTGKISWDILHPGYQGKSLGTALLRYRIEKLQSMDEVQRIIVRTSQVAYRFYEKQGFVLKEVTRDYWAPGFDLYFMEYRRMVDA